MMRKDDQHSIATKLRKEAIRHLYDSIKGGDETAWNEVNGKNIQDLLNFAKLEKNHDLIQRFQNWR